MNHNNLMIHILFTSILLLVAISIFIGLKRTGKSSDAATGAAELEKTFRKILETVSTNTTATPPKATIQDEDEKASAAAAVGTTAATAVPPVVTTVRETPPEVLATLDVLKKDVSEKDRQIQELKTALEQSKQAAPTNAEDQKKNEEAQAQFQEKLAALEKELGDAKARLSEYAIIEDDIANLSVYKSENVALKAEIEKLRRGRSHSKTAEAPDSDTQVSDVVAEFAAVVGAQDGGATSVAKAADNLTAETPIVQTPAPETAQAAPSMVGPAATPAPVAPETVTAPAAAASDENPLAIDSEKLIAEAANLPDAPAEEGKEEDGDAGQKLIAEFESFITEKQ